MPFFQENIAMTKGFNMKHIIQLLSKAISSDKKPKVIISILSLFILMTISYGSTQFIGTSIYTISAYLLISLSIIITIILIVLFNKKS